MSQSNLNALIYPPSGTRDFFPDDMLLRNWLFNIWSDVAKQYNYQQYDAPILEHSNLYTIKRGGDDILNEMYSFEKDNIKLCLRPEMTPSLTRMIMQILPSSILPLKWFSIPQCWRYETTTRGRKREHFQWNVDMFGTEKIKSETEILDIITTFLKKINLTSNDIVIKISNRKLLQKVLSNFGITEEDQFMKACNVFDKLEKLEKNDLIKMFKDNVNLSDEQIEKILIFSEIKNFDDLVNLNFLDKDDIILTEMKKIFENANKLGFGEWLQFDVSVIRGLSYYTGIVFEAYSKSTEMKRAILGGGAYENLLTTYGFPSPVPAIGFGCGDVVIMDILKELNKLPIFESRTDYVIIPFNDDYFADSCVIANKLREKGKTVDVYMKKTRLNVAYSYADRIKANNVILLAPDEWSNGLIVVKNLRMELDSTEKQKTVNLDEYLSSL